MFYDFRFVMLLACAAFYYRAAHWENVSGLLWTGLSVLVFVVTWIVLSLGLIGCLIGQVSLYIIITIIKVLRRSSQ